MKNRLTAFGLIMILLVGMTSCLGSDDDSDTEVYQDTAISAFTLGSMTRTLHTTSSTGEDSTYTVTVTGSNYKMTIDQQQGLIYNTDSLPFGTNVSRVLCTITTRNSGSAVLNLRTHDGLKDSLVYYSSTDSLDLTKPLEVRIYNQAGSAFRTYTVKVGVRQQGEEGMQWSAVDAPAVKGFASMQPLRLASVGEHVFAFGMSADGTHTLMTALSAGTSENDQASVMEYGAEAINNIVSRDSELLILDGDYLWRYAISENGVLQQWGDEGRNVADVQRLVGASAKELYALSKRGTLIVSVDDGLTWEEEQLDSDAALLPTENINSVVTQLRTNDGMQRVMLVGTRPDKEYAVVWMKIVDEELPGSGMWALVADGSGNSNAYGLKKIDTLCVTACDDGMLAFGMTADGTCADILLSADGGITWQTSELYAWPTDVSGTGGVAATTDSAGRLWLLMGGTGQLWRGCMK